MLQANPLDIRMDGVLFRDGPVVQMGSHHFPVQRFWNGMEGSTAWTLQIKEEYERSYERYILVPN